MTELERMHQILERLNARLERNNINKLMDELGVLYPLMTYEPIETTTDETDRPE